MEIKFRRTNAGAKMPERKHVTDAGYDLTCTEVEIDNNGNFVCHTGLQVEIPVGFAGFIFPRSSCSATDLIMANCVGVVDSGYRGEITCKFKALNYQPIAYKAGDRVAQLIILPVPDIRWTEAEQLTDSDRGCGGYGSTGK